MLGETGRPTGETGRATSGRPCWEKSRSSEGAPAELVGERRPVWVGEPRLEVGDTRLCGLLGRSGCGCGGPTRICGLMGGPLRAPPGGMRGLSGRTDKQVRGTTPWRERSRRMQRAWRC